MRELRNFINSIMQGNRIPDSVIYKHPIVEVIAMRRVLVENIRSIAMYDPNEIDIYVTGGTVSIIGTELSLVFMSKERIVIRGEIQSVEFLKEGRG